jgi:hypothetical protein
MAANIVRPGGPAGHGAASTRAGGQTAARVATLVGPDEVFVSSTVKDVVAGSGLRFAERGTHALKGVPDEWRLFAVERRTPRVGALSAPAPTYIRRGSARIVIVTTVDAR